MCSYAIDSRTSPSIAMSLLIASAGNNESRGLHPSKVLHSLEANEGIATGENHGLASNVSVEWRRHMRELLISETANSECTVSIRRQDNFDGDPRSEDAERCSSASKSASGQVGAHGVWLGIPRDSRVDSSDPLELPPSRCCRQSSCLQSHFATKICQQIGRQTLYMR